MCIVLSIGSTDATDKPKTKMNTITSPEAIAAHTSYVIAQTERIAKLARDYAIVATGGTLPEEPNVFAAYLAGHTPEADELSPLDRIKDQMRREADLLADVCGGRLARHSSDGLMSIEQA